MLILDGSKNQRRIFLLLLALDLVLPLLLSLLVLLVLLVVRLQMGRMTRYYYPSTRSLLSFSYCSYWFYAYVREFSYPFSVWYDGVSSEFVYYSSSCVF
jgi:hypothetical protein